MATPDIFPRKAARRGQAVSLGAPVQHASTPADPVVDLLGELVAEIRGLRADLAGKAIDNPLSRADRVLLAKMLPAIGGALGSEPFNSADICEHDAAALRLVSAGLNARQLGRLFRRAAGIPVDGYMVERLGCEAGAVVWRVMQVPEFPGNEKVSVPHATSRGLA